MRVIQSRNGSRLTLKEANCIPGDITIAIDCGFSSVDLNRYLLVDTCIFRQINFDSLADTLIRTADLVLRSCLTYTIK